MTYEQALQALSSAARFGIHPSLDGISMLCDVLGGPQEAFPVVQITGTNGKTSTARFTAMLLQASGLRTGLYTSPELERANERIEVDGCAVTDDAFASAVDAAVHAAASVGRLDPSIDLTEFELTTAAALWAFRERKVDVAVLEVGMGGRWDATSVASPLVAVITGVGLDHTEILGDTLVEIAAEKAAIIRPGSTAVLARMPEEVRSVFDEAARGSGVDVVTPEAMLDGRPDSVDGVSIVRVETQRGTYGDLRVNAPAYQADNLALAIAAAEIVLGRRLDRVAVDHALGDVCIPGRFEVLLKEPPVVVDGSHNPQAATVLAGAIEDAWPNRAKRPTVLLGVLADKDADGIVEALSRVCDDLAVTRPHSPRALPAADLAAVVHRRTGVVPLVFGDVSSALDELTIENPHGLVITGSLTTAGEARRLVREWRRSLDPETVVT